MKCFNGKHKRMTEQQAQRWIAKHDTKWHTFVPERSVMQWMRWYNTTQDNILPVAEYTTGRFTSNG